MPTISCSSRSFSSSSSSSSSSSLLSSSLFFSWSAFRQDAKRRALLGLLETAVFLGVEGQHGLHLLVRPGQRGAQVRRDGDDTKPHPPAGESPASSASASAVAVAAAAAPMVAASCTQRRRCAE